VAGRADFGYRSRLGLFRAEERLVFAFGDMAVKGAVHFVAIATRSHLGQAMVLAESLKQVHPEAPRTLFLVEPEVREHDRDCGWTVRPVAELNVPDGSRFFFQYTAFQLCCALKPFAIEAVLKGPKTDGAVYLDTDFYAVAPFLDLVWEGWQQGDVGLTPHLKSDQYESRLHRFLRFGSYNAGFLAVRNGPTGHRFLKWFQKRLERHCIRDFRRGIFDDQKWLDLAVSICEGIVLLRSPGLNVGPWNREELWFEGQGEDLIVKGRERLRLLHFTTREEQAFLGERTPSEKTAALKPILVRYRHAIQKALERFPPSEPYGYGFYRDGTPIEPMEREAVRKGLVTVPDPFSSPAEVKAAVSRVAVPPDWQSEKMALQEMIRLRAHPVIGRVWRFWKRWINHDLP